MSEAQRRNAEKIRQANEVKREATTEHARKAKNAFVYSTIIVLISSFVMAIFSIGTVIYFNQKWCAVIILFDETYDETPPTTEAGKTLAHEFKQLRRSFFC